MEIINDNKAPQGGSQNNDNRNNTPHNGLIYFGSVLILIGLLWLMRNFDIIGRGVFDIIFSWSMLMVVIGGYLISIRKMTAGLIIGGIGFLLVLADILNIHISFSLVVMPLCIIAIGCAVLLSAIDRKKSR